MTFSLCSLPQRPSNAVSKYFFGLQETSLTLHINSAAIHSLQWKYSSGLSIYMYPGIMTMEPVHCVYFARKKYSTVLHI